MVSRVGCNVHVNDRIKTVDNVSAGGTDVYQNSFTAIVDTGTTLVYLPDSCYNDIVRYFQAHHSNPIWNSSVRRLVKRGHSSLLIIFTNRALCLVLYRLIIYLVSPMLIFSYLGV